MVVVQARHQKKPVKKTATRARAKAKSEPNVWQRHQRDLSIVVLIVVGLFVALADVHALGPVGHQISRALSDVLGVGRFALALILLGLGVSLVWGKVEFDQARVSWGGLFAMIGVSGIADLTGGRPGVHATTHVLGHAGGWLGVVTGGALASAIGVAGATIILLALLVVAIIVVTGVGLRGLVTGVGVVLSAIGRTLSRWWTARSRREEQEDEEVDEPVADVAPSRRARLRLVEPEGVDEADGDDGQQPDDEQQGR